MHTPGPWNVESDDGVDFTVLGGKSSQVRIAVECSERDARLIARAPELRAALAWALDQIEDDLDPDHQAALAHARSLLED